MGHFHFEFFFVIDPIGSDAALSLLSLVLQLGRAYFLIGNYSDAEKMTIKGMEILGLKSPLTSSKFGMSSILNFPSLEGDSNAPLLSSQSSISHISTSSRQLETIRRKKSLLIASQLLRLFGLISKKKGSYDVALRSVELGIEFNFSIVIQMN